MSAASAQFTPGTIRHLSESTKGRWELGQARLIARGDLADDGSLGPAAAKDAAWELSVRSIEKAGSFREKAAGQNLTLIAGDFIQLSVDGRSRGLEPLRPLQAATNAPVEASQPAQELLILHLWHHPERVRATVRIVELSRQREQYLFDGQLAVLLQGSATVRREGHAEQGMQLRDTVYGGDRAQVRLAGRGFLAVVSLDRPHA